jgi:spermidine/putrescine transport system substrate-binding protein
MRSRQHIADCIKYATANAAAKAIMDKSYTENPSIFPPAEIVAKCEPSLYLGKRQPRSDEIWTRIQAAW